MKINQRLLLTAGEVIDKVCGYSKQPARVAVFRGKNGKAIQMTRLDSAVFEKAFDVRKDDFVGIYTPDATVQMIVDDLEFMEVTA